MSITFDSVAHGETVGNPLTFSHTCTGVNLILFVGVNNGLSQAVNGITYNGVSMTAVTTAVGATNQVLYYLLNPATGAHNVVVNVNNSNAIQAISASYTGVSQTSQPEAFNHASSSGTSVSTTVTTVSNNSWVIAFGGIQALSTQTAGSGFTLRLSTNDGANSLANGLEDTNGVKTPPGAVTTAMTFSGSNPNAITGASIAPVNIDRYWVGGAGNWDTSTTTHWSSSSGGSGGASAPVSTNNVVFDSNSGSGTVTMTADISCFIVNLTGSTVGLSMGSQTLTLIGTGTVWTATSGNTITPATSTIKLTDASSSTKTFSGGGLTYNNFYITGAGTGAYTIVGNNTFSDFKCDTPPHTINFTAGSITTTNTFTVNGTAGNLMTLQSTSNGLSWYLVKSPTGTVTCDYLSLRDSHAS